jgi:hypothetical protein
VKIFSNDVIRTGASTVSGNITHGAVAGALHAAITAAPAAAVIGTKVGRRAAATGDAGRIDACCEGDEEGGEGGDFHFRREMGMWCWSGWRVLRGCGCGTSW